MGGLRGALYLWSKHGASKVTGSVVAALSRKQYSSGAKPNMAQLLRGKLTWVGHVNGKSDKKYQKLAIEFNRLVAKDSLSALALKIDPVVNCYADAASATWFVRSESTIGDYDCVDGTAFKIAGQEWVTCPHCIGDLRIKKVRETITLYSHDSTIKPILVRVAKVDWGRDLAILRPQPLELVPRYLAYFEFAKSIPAPATTVGLMGYPSSHERQLPIFLRSKIVRLRMVSGVERVEIDKQIMKGHSGGPVFDENYKVVGVVVEGGTIDVGMNSCVNANEIKKLRI